MIVRVGGMPDCVESFKQLCGFVFYFELGNHFENT